jgi:hypothetical protein
LIWYLNAVGIKSKLNNSGIMLLDIIQIISKRKVCSWRCTWAVFFHMLSYFLRSFWYIVSTIWSINTCFNTLSPFLSKFHDGGHLDDVNTACSSQFMQFYLSISWSGVITVQYNIGSLTCTGRGCTWTLSGPRTSITCIL